MGCKPLGLAQHQRGNPLLRRGFLPSPTQRPGLGTRDRVQVTGCRVQGARHGPAAGFTLLWHRRKSQAGASREHCSTANENTEFGAKIDK